MIPEKWIDRVINIGESESKERVPEKNNNDQAQHGQKKHNTCSPDRFLIFQDQEGSKHKGKNVPALREEKLC